MWFPDAPNNGAEHPGKKSAANFPIDGVTIVLCEAKASLNPELIGQALVYDVFARRAGGNVQSTLVFAEKARLPLKIAAEDLGLSVVVESVS